MRSIAVITMIFLPGTFFAVCQPIETWNRKLTLYVLEYILNGTF